MSRANLYIRNNKVYLYPRKSSWFGVSPKDLYVSETDLKQNAESSLKTIRVGDYIMPTNLKRDMVEKIYEEFSKEKNSTSENMINLMLFAIGVFEDKYLIVNQVMDIKGQGQKGKIITKPFYVVPSNADGEPPLMMELTYSYTGQKTRSRSVSAFQADYNNSRYAKSALAVIEGFAEIAMLVTPSPSGKVGRIVKPVVKRTARKATKRFFKAIPNTVVKALKNKVVRWSAALMKKLSIALAKALAVELHQQNKRSSTMSNFSQNVDQGKVHKVVRRVIRDTITDVISKEIVEAIMGPLKKVGASDAKRALKKEIEKYLTNRFVERILDVATHTCVRVITSIPVSGDEGAYSKELQRGIEQKLISDNKLMNFVRAEFENALQEMVKGNMALK
jgi:hypothetical protein